MFACNQILFKYVPCIGMLASSYVKYIHCCFPKDSTSRKSAATESLIIRQHGHPLNEPFVPTPPPQVAMYNSTRYQTHAKLGQFSYQVFMVLLLLWLFPSSGVAGMVLDFSLSVCAVQYVLHL